MDWQRIVAIIQCLFRIAAFQGTKSQPSFHVRLEKDRADLARGVWIQAPQNHRAPKIQPSTHGNHFI